MSDDALYHYKKRLREVTAQRLADRRHMEELFSNIEYYGEHITERLVLYDSFHPDYVNKLRTASGDTLLHYAAKCGKVTVVQTLLALGADPNAMNLDNKKPEDVICTRLWAGRFPEIAELSHEYYRDQIITSTSNECVNYGSCQDPSFSLYVEIRYTFKAAEVVRAQEGTSV